MVKSVDEEPYVTLERWGIMQDIGGYRLVGIATDTQGGRVSSPVIAFDGHARMVETASGRVYHLRGEPDPLVTAAIIRAHIAKWGLRSDEVAIAEVWELDQFLRPKPGGWMN